MAAHWKPRRYGQGTALCQHIPDSDWALEALRWTTENGAINGKGNGILDPTGQATRADTAQMFKNFLESH